MKKYLLGIFAVALAIGFSAFTTKEKKTEKTLQTQFDYWYDTQNNGTKIHAIVINTPNQTKDDALGQTSCTDAEDQPVCLVGSDDPNLMQGSSLPLETVDNYIRRSDEN